jgi:D-arabinose 5-phosphate isomerase GutQ
MEKSTKQIKDEISRLKQNSNKLVAVILNYQSDIQKNTNQILTLQNELIKKNQVVVRV